MKDVTMADGLPIQPVGPIEEDFPGSKFSTARPAQRPAKQHVNAVQIWIIQHPPMTEQHTGMSAFSREFTEPDFLWLHHSLAWAMALS